MTMTRFAVAAVLAVCLAAVPSLTQDKGAKPARGKGPAIGHMVYFKLKTPTPENRQKLVAACEKYLADHEGVTFFAAGVISDDFKREVNDRDWDVALHLVFDSKAAHDKYQDHPEHLKFIEENKDGWAKVRVFDSEFTPTAKKRGGGKK
jgi:hypothetical protein